VTHRIFIDGQAGTTGLEIHARLRERSDLQLLEIDPQHRKDPAARRDLLNAADVVVLCLPDEAAREAVSLIAAPSVRVLDASSAHRTAAGWAYGLAELARDQREAIAAAQRVANPGCYPTGFLLLLRPLVDAGLVDAGAALTVHALSGYTGGGRALVERYEARAQAGMRVAPRSYALDLAHKHLPEMRAHAGLGEPPLFTPMVGDFARGMLVQVPLTAPLRRPGTTAEDLTAALAERYADEPCIHVHPTGAPEALVDGGFLDPEARNGSNAVDLMVFGHADQQVLVARLDNLGKGAGGAAVQNLNLMLGCEEFTGIETGTRAPAPSDTRATA
jgi:N-acetyl-gamma-glutamyl-phosphate reductase